MIARLTFWLLLVAVAATPAQAQTTAAQVTNVGLPATTVQVGVTYGWEFTPTNDIIVTELGIVDVGGNGLLEAHSMRLYDPTGTLIVASVPAGTAAPLIDGTRWTTVTTPRRLEGGVTYMVAAYYPSANTEQLYFENADGTTVSYASGISPGRGMFVQSSFGRVTRPNSQIAFRPHGPNLRYTSLGPFPVLNWPTGPAPCNDLNSLQSCMNILQAGDVVRIATNAAPAQIVNISGSAASRFFLLPATGFAPVFASLDLSIDLGSVLQPSIWISGLAANGGRLRVSRPGVVPFTGTILINDNTLPGIEVANVGAETVTIMDNQVTIPLGGATRGISVEDGGRWTTIARNTIQHAGGGQPVGIFNRANTGSVNVDIQGNHVHGAGFNGGIDVGAAPSANMTARIANNVVTGVDSPDNGWGISAALEAGNNGRLYVVNNSVAYGANGILVSDIDGRARNNIVAFNTGTGLQLETVSDAVDMAEAANLLHGNGTNYLFPGTPGRAPAGAIFADPLFADPVALTLQPTSPALNSGAPLGFPSLFSLLNADFAGDYRLQWIVDRGAWEAGDARSDQDGDMVTDPLDNCMTAANGTQVDGDADQYGNRCDGDFNQTGNVNAADLAIFRANFGSTNVLVDLNGIGSVNAADLAIFRSLFGKSPGPSGPLACAPDCAWSTGEMVTGDQAEWGDGGTTMGAILSANFTGMYGGTNGLGVGGIHRLLFGSPSAVFAYLPASGDAGVLNGTIGNPLSSPSGRLGGEVVALKLNIDMSGALGNAVAFGDLLICDFDAVPGLSGTTVNQFLVTASLTLGGSNAGISASTAANVASLLNTAFVAGAPSTFAQTSLVAGSCPAN